MSTQREQVFGGSIFFGLGPHVETRGDDGRMCLTWVERLMRYMSGQNDFWG